MNNVQGCDGRACSNRALPAIFILGISPRSGTNFLHRLLCMHPECGGVDHTPIREDYLLKHAHLLDDFVRKTAWQWSHWGDATDLRTSALDHIGNGLISFTQGLCDARHPILKTPSVEGINYFRSVFSRSPLLIIVRDGRSVVASGMSGFGWSFEAATRYWSRAARAIMSFQASAPPDSFHIVRYEALNEHTEKELKSIFKFLNLDPKRYDFDEAINLPVYGSSFSGTEEEGVDWSTVEKTEDFSSNRRWKDWDRALHERFNWLAGKELEALGYELQFSQPASVAASLYHGAKDLSHRVRMTPRHIFHVFRHGAKTARRHLRVTKDTQIR